MQVPIEERERLLLKAGLDPAELTNLTLVYQDPLTQACGIRIRAVSVSRPSAVEREGPRLERPQHFSCTYCGPVTRHIIICNIALSAIKYS